MHAGAEQSRFTEGMHDDQVQILDSFSGETQAQDEVLSEAARSQLFAFTCC